MIEMLKGRQARQGIVPLGPWTMTTDEWVPAGDNHRALSSSQIQSGRQTFRPDSTRFRRHKFHLQSVAKLRLQMLMLLYSTSCVVCVSVCVNDVKNQLVPVTGKDGQQVFMLILTETFKEMCQSSIRFISLPAGLLFMSLICCVFSHFAVLIVYSTCCQSEFEPFSKLWDEVAELNFLPMSYVRPGLQTQSSYSSTIS